MADAFTNNFNLTLPEIGGSPDTWGVKLNANFGEIDKFLVPLGGIIMWSGSATNVPPGWALCDGENGTPDLTDRFVVGAGNSYAAGDEGGANSVTLTTTQIPAHNHGASTANNGGHTHGASSGNAGGHNHTMGGAGAHNHTTGNSGYHSHSGSTTHSGAHEHHMRGWRIEGGNRKDDTTATEVLLGARISTRNWDTTGTYASAHSHALSINGNGSHAHSVSTIGNHTHTINSNGAHTHTITINSVGDHNHAVTVQNTGGGGSHENRPPYYAIAFIMCIGG